MSKKTKIWFVIATCLVLIGCIIFGGVMTLLKWDFKKLSTVKYETNTYDIDNSFNNISIKTDTSDIIFEKAKDGKTKLVCYEPQNAKHMVEVKDNTLTVELSDKRKWYEYIGINIGAPKITVFLPETEYGTLFIKKSTGNTKLPNVFKFKSIDISASTGDIKAYASATEDIKIKTSTGDINVKDITAETIELSVTTGRITASNITVDGDFKTKVSTGKTYLTDIKCKNLLSDGSTGDIALSNVIATEKFNIERDTGDVKLQKCDASEIFIETDTGSVKGDLLSSKVFITKTDTGRVDVPKTAEGGRCEITTDTGDIKITVD